MSPEGGPPPHRLPAWARGLLRRVLPLGITGASIEGDLAQEYAGRRPGIARFVWLAVEVARMGFHYRRGGGRTGGAVRFALRRMRRDPAFSGLAVLTTALGIGITVALFSVVEVVLLKPLPYDQPDRLVALFEAHRPRNVTRNVANPGNVAAWSGVAALTEVEAVVMPRPWLVAHSGEPRELMGNIVTPGYLRLLGVEPESGSGFTPDADGAGQRQVMLTRRGAIELFGNPEEAVGSTLDLDGAPARVVGVLPPILPPFASGSALLVAMPMADMGDQTNSGRFLNVIARLSPGSSLESVRRELAGVQVGLRESFPEFNAGWDVEVESLRAVLLGDLRVPLWTLFAAGGVLLLVAAVNVANLTLVRATERRAEMAVRTALGASGAALAGQLIVESLVLAILGGALGLGLATAGLRLLTPALLDAFTIPRLGTLSLDAEVRAFAVAVTLGTGLLFGLAPALSASRRRPARTLRAEVGGSSRRAGALRASFVVAEVALSVVLLVSAGLLARSFAAVTSVDTGFDADRVITGRVNLVGERYRGDEPDRRFLSALEDRLADLSGVEAAGGIAFLPLDGLGSATSYYAADRAVPPREDWAVADIRPVLGDYFAAMGIRLLSGRTFRPNDDDASARVVVVSRSLAEAAWPGEDPLGRPLAINWDDLDPWTVIGVVDDVVHAGMTEKPRATVYHTIRQAAYFPFMSLVVRTRGSAAEAVEAMRAEVAAIDPGIPLARVRTMTSLVRSATARPRVTAFLVTLFAGAAAVLAAVGLYGTLAVTVARRVPEIGVRMALGARAHDMVSMVTWQGLRLVAFGLVGGLALAAVATRIFAALLFDVSASDPWVFAGAAAAFLLVGALACIVPATRAVRIRPARALRGN